MALSTILGFYIILMKDIMKLQIIIIDHLQWSIDNRKDEFAHCSGGASPCYIQIHVFDVKLRYIISISHSESAIW